MSRIALFLCALLGAAFAPAAAAPQETPPNIIIILGDNIGYGELSCYGSSRMVETPRLDHLASQGLRLTNFNVETWCAPSRSALLTGRYGIRSGTSQAPQFVTGIVPWEVTLAELLSARGYSTALFGKWHLGDHAGRFPTDQGFDEFWGIAKSWDGALIPSRPNFTPKASDMAFILSGTRGKKIEEGNILDLESGNLMDRTLADKSIDFIQRKTREKKPFFLYVPVAAVHLPVYVDPDFDGKSGAGFIGDAMMAIDFHVGRILDALDAAGIADNTIVIFTSDNGPESQDPYRGTAGPWSGSYNTALEGGLRVPFLLRWPGHVPAGRVSNEIVHITDLFTTLAHIAGARVPTDRMIDGVDQTDFFTAKQEHSNRDSFPVYLFGQLAAVKWKDWKLHMASKPNNRTMAQNPDQRLLFNLRSDPKEERSVYWENDAVVKAINEWIVEFQKTLETDPPIPPGAPDSYKPPRPTKK
jgi:arylsulfatase